MNYKIKYIKYKNKYILLKNQRGGKIKTKEKIYFTHDNGGRPFMVNINKNNVDIYTVSKNFNYEKNDYTDLAMSYKNVKNIFIGKSAKGDDMYASYPNNPAKAEKAGLGNSILLNLSGNKYVFIGEYVYEFETDDHIKEFYSMIGHSDVPYPVAIGTHNVYFLIDKGDYGYLSREYFKDFPKKYSWALDSYSKLWAQNKFSPKLPKNISWNDQIAAEEKDSLMKFVKKIPKVKIIINRQ